ncbi:MAG: NrtA/SsuA/CpmA family ABC transporter substrate-binding protein [Candidatus Rokubacteria bacterium]|nr:NrtA/SsuA/CpmA family ABC transporter substrate-binding protein [Candidatus Rokubacteria bacterium]
MRKTLAFAVLAVVMLVPGRLPSEVEAQKPLKIRLAVHGSIMGAADVIAIRQGYFKEAGLDVEWRRFALGKEGRDAMIAGAIDLNATAPTPFMIGLDKGVPYTAIGVNSVFCSANHIVALKSSDINSVSQLRGKKIGLPKGTITEYVFVTRIAPGFGLKAEDYQVANIPDAKDRIPSLVAKAVDLAALGEPHTAIAEKDGTVRVVENFCKYDPLPFMLTATNKIIKENPDAVVAYLRGWLRAIKLLKEEPIKAAAVYAEEQKSLGRTVDVPVIDVALRRMRWEPDLTADIEKYLVDQAKDLVTPAGGKRIAAVPEIAKALNRDLLTKARAAR